VQGPGQDHKGRRGVGVRDREVTANAGERGKAEAGKREGRVWDGHEGCVEPIRD
jgi:hypothetical protein